MVELGEPIHGELLQSEPREGITIWDVTKLPLEELAKICEARGILSPNLANLSGGATTRRRATQARDRVHSAEGPMSYSTIISPHHMTFLNGLSISFAPTPEGVDGEYGGTYIPPVMPECTVTPVERVCQYCDAACTADDKTCPNCGAPDDGKREPNAQP